MRAGLAIGAAVAVLGAVPASAGELGCERYSLRGYTCETTLKAKHRGVFDFRECRNPTGLYATGGRDPDTGGRYFATWKRTRKPRRLIAKHGRLRVVAKRGQRRMRVRNESPFRVRIEWNIRCPL